MLQEFFAGGGNTLFGLYDMFVGGAFTRATVFALGIMPYISASIILQLMGAVVPFFQKLQREGEEGRRKINQYTRYGTVFLAAAQSLGVSYFLESIRGPGSGVDAVFDPGIGFRLMTMLTITAGTIFIMWLGEQITERGIGNGISLIIFVGIVAELPFAVKSEWQNYLLNRGFSKSLIEEIFLVALMVVIVAFVVLLTQGQRKIPVQYAKRVVGRRVYGGQTTHIPLRINSAGVIPIIFAQSIMFLPGTVTQFFPENDMMQWLGAFFTMDSLFYWGVYATMIVFFCYFYTAIVMDPNQLADNMKRHGGLHTGRASGKTHGGVYRSDHDANHASWRHRPRGSGYFPFFRHAPVSGDPVLFPVLRGNRAAHHRRGRSRYAAAVGIAVDDPPLRGVHEGRRKDSRKAPVRRLPREVEELKVRASIGKRCSECRIIRRNGVVRVICKRNPRHKQRQG